MIVIHKKAVIAEERLYTDATKTKVLKEGDKGAAFLLAPKGGEIPLKLAERLGLLKEEEPKASPPASTKAIAERKTRVPGDLEKRG